MSIIGGIVGTFNNEQCKNLLEAMNQYKTDSVKVQQLNNIWMACGMQHFTEESLSEVLPFSTQQLMMTADAILDNREQLIQELNLKVNTTDSQIILEAYKTWGEACSLHLLGEYAFAIWDIQKQVLFCVRDHVGKRSLYYKQSKNQFMFCTVMEPILQSTHAYTLNDKWIADFLTIQGVIHEISIDETIYKDIKQLPPGHQMCISLQQIDTLNITQYWHPENIRPLTLSTDAEYEEAFRQVLDEAVKCRLRTSGNIGIMLSGGLDSTSVAAMAAPELAKRNQKLISFTEIPVASYENQLGKAKIINESAYIEEMQKYYPNIEAYYDDFKQSNAFEGIDKRIQILEQPYKIIENLYWIEGIIEKAQEKNCKILLDGQFGNFSVSQGNLYCYWNTLFHQGKLVTLAKEIRRFCKRYRIGYTRVYMVVFKKLFMQFFSGHLKLDELSCVNPKLAKQYHCLERIREKGYLFDEYRMLEEKTQRQFVTNLILFSHMGSLETKYSLHYDVLRRDPTRDKRVVEFCLSVPIKQYAQRGVERSLIRRAMKGLIPDSIRLNFHSRGKQAADWVYRLEPYHEQIVLEVEQLLSNESLAQYLDLPKLKVLLEKYKQNKDLSPFGFELKVLMIAITLKSFNEFF